MDVLQTGPFGARFAVIIFTYLKIGGKLPVTKSKTGNICLPICNLFTYREKFSLPTGIFESKGKLFMVKSSTPNKSNSNESQTSVLKSPI